MSFTLYNFGKATQVNTYTHIWHTSIESSIQSINAHAVNEMIGLARRTCTFRIPLLKQMRLQQDLYFSHYKPRPFQLSNQFLKLLNSFISLDSFRVACLFWIHLLISYSRLVTFRLCACAFAFISGMRFDLNIK